MRLIGAATVYLGTGALNKAIPFLLLPVLTRYLSPEAYGTLSLFQVLIGFCAPFVGMQMHINITRNFETAPPEEMSRWIGNLYHLLAMSTLAVSASFFLYLLVGGRTFGVPSSWFLLVPISCSLNVACTLYQTVLRSQRRPFAFGAFAVANTAVDLMLSLLLIVGFGYGWQGRGYGLVVSSLVLGSVGLLLLRRDNLCRWRLDRDKLREAFTLCLPLIPHALGGAVIYLSDRLFIEQMAGKAAVGIYTVGCNFGMIVALLVEAFGNAWSPWFYRELAQSSPASRLAIVRYSYLYFAAVLLAAFVVTGSSYLVLPYMVPQRYQDASQFILWTAIGFAFRGMYTIVVPFLIHTRNTSFLGMSTIATAAVNLVLNYFMIPAFGGVGAAQATLIAFLLQFIVTWGYAARVCPMPWLDRGVWARRATT